MTKYKRAQALVRANRLMVIEDDDTRRQFLKSNDQAVGKAWDRICCKDGQVYVEAWPDNYLREGVTARYLDFTEGNIT